MNISLAGAGASPLSDTFLRLRDSAGNAIAADDDGGAVGYNSLLSFTAPTSGTYYIDVGAYRDEGAGTYQLDVTEYVPPPPPPVYSYDQIAEQLVNGYWAATGSQSHQFNVTAGGSLTVNLTALTDAGLLFAREALAVWSDVTGISFTEVATGGQITFDDNESGAFSYSYWDGAGIISSSHVNVSTDWIAGDGTNLNSYSLQTYIHEIGHALGLGHSGNYNGSATYSTDALYANDSWATTIMSYFSQYDNTYFADQGSTHNYVLTPIMGDILGVSMMYGTATTTRTGNTTYGFNSNAGRAIFDASVYPDVAYTIIDNGGTDTLNYSSYTSNQRIDLRAETFSNIGTGVGNVSIARGVVIENAMGGSGNDTMFGNAANNILNGGGGADTLRGGEGDDIYIVDDAGDRAIEISSTSGTDLVKSYVSFTLRGFAENLALMESSAINGTGNSLNNKMYGNGAANVLNGGAGADTMRGGAGNDTYIVDRAGDQVIEGSSTGGIDLVKSLVGFTLGANIENLTLTGTGGTRGTGNGQANVIIGNGAGNILSGSAGNDSLSGGGGADTLMGGTGNDSLNGGAGADLFRFDTALNASTNVDRIIGFSVADDTIQFDDDIFTAAGGVGGLAASAFRAGTSAADANDRIIYDSATGRISQTRTSRLLDKEST